MQNKNSFMKPLCCVQHLRNAIKFQKATHSRFMENLAHPEDYFLLCGESKKYRAEGGKKYNEHIVPLVVLRDQSKRLIEEGKDDEYIAKLFAKHWKLAHITKDEAAIMDKKLGLKSRMPDGWSFEEGNTFARLEAASIELI